MAPGAGGITPDIQWEVTYPGTMGKKSGRVDILGLTSRGAWYASVIREAHRSGPVTVDTVSLSDRFTGSVRPGVTVHGDRSTVTLNGTKILEGRDTVGRSGGLVLCASTPSVFDDLSVARSCKNSRSNG